MLMFPFFFCIFHPWQLNPANKDGVKYIITTCLDPWSTSMEFIDDLAGIMRNAILNAIGTVSKLLNIGDVMETKGKLCNDGMMKLPNCSCVANKRRN